MSFLKDFDNFRLSDAISFHDELNPVLWDGQELRPEVKEQLLYIAKDFLEELGVNDLDVTDITVSGSNAAFSYTPHSDLDLHILVDLSKMDNNEIYKELFNAKKTIYNDTHNITIHGVPVELYVQDAREPVVSLGEYSILHDEWLRIPTKRRANLDQTATKAKYEKLHRVITKALQSKNIVQVEQILKKIKQYRQAGLDHGGEFGPENLAYKILRKQGLITKLYDLRNKLHSEELTIDEDSTLLDKPTPTIRQVSAKHGVSFTDIMDQLVKGVNVELEHTTDEKVAREIALDHLSEDPEYYTKLAGVGLEEDSYSMNPGPYAAEKTLPVTPYGNQERQFRGSIAESLDQPYPVRWVKSKDSLDANAETRLPDTTKLQITFRAEEDDSGEDTVVVNFFRDNSQEITDEGDSQRVFATVLNSISQYIQEYNPQRMSFVASKDVGEYRKKESRAKLYASLIKRYSAKWGYSFSLVDHGEFVVYELYKNAPINEASGYIPSEKEKNDPRFKTALTVDVKPDTIKKNAKAFSWLTDRAGIPPTLKPSGKF